jgi:uncharacterized protein (TIGR00661 family)
MTQALALSAFLRDAGHEVSRVLIGRSPHRSIPAYFASAIASPVQEFDAPTQVPGGGRQGLSLSRTALDTLRRSPLFLRSVVDIARATADADVVVNLLDLMGGLSRLLLRSDVPALAVAHNHLFLHPDLAAAPGPAQLRRLVMAYTRTTAAGTRRKLALSFTPLENQPALGLEVAPPLLRPGLDALEVRDEGFFLAYALNSGYGVTLARWQGRHPEVAVHCYVDGGSSALDVESSSGFHAHDLDDQAFLGHLARCRAYVGSAGFESICEAHYLGKPVLAVPTAGQFEQTLNAWDAERCGVARAGGYEDLDSFWTEASRPSDGSVERFRSWVSRAPALLVDAVERTAHNGGSRARS